MGSRQASEERLIQAVGKIIARQGTAGLGVNAIAREANVNKALIYRYFGDLSGLLKSFADSQDFWPDLNEILGPDPRSLLEQRPAPLLATIMRNHCEALLRRPMTIEILAQECLARDELTIILEEIREKRSEELYKFFLENYSQPISSQKMQVFFGSGALLSGALHYFLIRARFIKIYGGLDIQSPAGREQIYQLIEALARGLDAE